MILYRIIASTACRRFSLSAENVYFLGQDYHAVHLAAFQTTSPDVPLGIRDKIGIICAESARAIATSRPYHNFRR